MRFRLVCRSSNRLFQLYVGGTLIPVRYPSLRRQDEENEQIVWTWLDGVEYAMLRPRWPDDHVRVVSGAQMVSCGQFFFGLGRLPRVLRQGKVTVSEWECNGQTIVWEGRNLCWKMFPYSFTLRQRDGIRLAFFSVERGRSFRPGFAYNGVMRAGLREDAVPVLFGILLAGIHAPLLMGY
jgi:hypothetical protein